MLADRLGRKSVFQFTLLLFAVATLLCAVAQNFHQMLAFRFLVGIGLGGELPVVSSLLSEFVPSAKRGRFIVLLESFWAYGWLVASLVAFFVIPHHGWRIAFTIGAIPAIYIWIVRRSVPESPRWYASRGRYAEANAVVSELEIEVAQVTRQDLPPVQEDSTIGSSGNIARRGFRQLWSPAYRRHTIVLWVLWFGLVFGYYGVFVWLPSLLVKAGYSMVNSFLYVLIITIAQIPGYFSAAYLIDRVGRRPVIAGFLVLSAVSAVIFGLSSTTAQILCWASLMSFFNLGAWGAVYTYTPELYPTAFRATGTGSAAAIGRIGGMIAPVLVGLMLPYVGRPGVMVLNAAMLAMAGICVAVLGPETKGKPLEELAL